MPDADLEDVEILTVYISNDWMADDIQTIEDCKDAHVFLISACAAIEHRIDTLTATKGAHRQITKAKSALKWKKPALAPVNAKRSRIARPAQLDREATRDKLVLTYLGSEHPKLVKEADE